MLAVGYSTDSTSPTDSETSRRTDGFVRFRLWVVLPLLDGRVNASEPIGLAICAAFHRCPLQLLLTEWAIVVQRVRVSGHGQPRPCHQRSACCSEWISDSEGVRNVILV